MLVIAPASGRFSSREVDVMSLTVVRREKPLGGDAWILQIFSAVVDRCFTGVFTKSRV
jgi:hypothetical protein